MTGKEKADIAISVIMPVFNSEEFVERAVISVLTQDFGSFELIAIDDGSADSSGVILDRLALADVRLRVVHRDNAGLCSARNLGIQEAKGEYIVFCDNDDIYLPGFLEDAYRIAFESSADFVRFGVVQQRIDSGGETIREVVNLPPMSGVFNQEALAEHPEYFFGGPNGVWGCLYRRSLLLENRISFDERLHHGREDVLFNDNVYSSLRTIAFSQSVYYVWERRESHSASMNLTEDRVLGFSLALEKEYELFKAFDLYQKHPDFCAQRFVMQIKDVLTMNQYQKERSFSAAVNNYKTARSLLLPYRAEIESAHIGFQYSIMQHCLFKEKYLLLHSFIKVGVAYKKAGQLQKSSTS